MQKYRVYEAVNSNGERFKEHGHFNNLEDAQSYATEKHLESKTNSTFVINYTNDQKEVCEQYYGYWSN